MTQRRTRTHRRRGVRQHRPRTQYAPRQQQQHAHKTSSTLLILLSVIAVVLIGITIARFAQSPAIPHNDTTSAHTQQQVAQESTPSPVNNHKQRSSSKKAVSQLREKTRKKTLKKSTDRLKENNNSDLHAQPIHPTRIREGSFEIHTTMPTLPVVTCDYRIPMGASDKALPTASDIVLLFPYPSEKQAIKGTGKILTDRWGFTTISIRFPGMGQKSSILGSDKSRWYYYPESGSGPAWLEAIQRVQDIAQLTPRPVFVTGRSGGGSASGLFADAYPDAVAAVANEAGRVFADPSQFKGPILLMHGAHDYVVPPVLKFMTRTEENDLTVSRYTYPANWSRRGKGYTWQHGITRPAQDAMWRWLIDLADMRLTDGQITAMAEWPLNENNQYSPSQTFKELIDKITPIAHIEYSNEATVITATVAPALSTAGTVFFAASEFSSDREELTLDAECLADQKWTCIAVLTRSAAETPSALHAQVAGYTFPRNTDALAILMADEPTTLLHILQTNTHAWNGIVLSKPRSSLLVKIARLCAQQSLPLLVVGAKTHLSSLKKHLATTDIPADSLSWRTFSGDNFGQWRQQHLTAVVKQLKRWSFDKRHDQ